MKENKKATIKKVARLIPKFGIDSRSSSDKENLNVVGQKLKKSLKRKKILTNNKITKSKIRLSMPLLEDEINVSSTLKPLGHGTLTTKNTGNISFNGEASKPNIKNDKLALNVQEHLSKSEVLNALHLDDSNALKINALQNITPGTKYCLKGKEKLSEVNQENEYDIKNDDVVLQLRSNVDFQKKLFQPTYDRKNKLDYYPELVKPTDLEDDEQTIIIEDENFDDSINDNYDHYNGIFDKKQLPSIKAVSVSEDDIEINQHLPILPLKRKHSIKACGRNHRQADINEQNWESNSRYFQVIHAGEFLHSRFDYCKLNAAFLDVVIFLPNRDPDQDEKRTCMIKVSSMLLKDNILNLIINPLLNTVRGFTEPEAAFVLQKRVDLIMEKVVVYQVDGPPSKNKRFTFLYYKFKILFPGFKFRLEQTNKYTVRSSKNKLLYDEIDSDDDISDEDDLNNEYDLNIEYKNCIYCRYKKIIKRRNSFHIQLYNGVIKINGKERYFNTLKGIAIFQ